MTTPIRPRRQAESDKYITQMMEDDSAAMMDAMRQFRNRKKISATDWYKTTGAPLYVPAEEPEDLTDRIPMEYEDEAEMEYRVDTGEAGRGTPEIQQLRGVGYSTDQLLEMNPYRVAQDSMAVPEPVEVVDRLEETPDGIVAVLVSDEGEEDRIVPIGELPEGIKEGDVLRGGEIDAEETMRRMEEAEDRLERMQASNMARQPSPSDATRMSEQEGGTDLGAIGEMLQPAEQMPRYGHLMEKRQMIKRR